MVPVIVMGFVGVAVEEGTFGGSVGVALRPLLLRRLSPLLGFRRVVAKRFVEPTACRYRREPVSRSSHARCR